MKEQEEKKDRIRLEAVDREKKKCGKEKRWDNMCFG